MRKVKRNSLLIITSIFISLLIPVVYNHKKVTNFEVSDVEKIHPSAEQSYTKQWLTNPNFSTLESWYSSKVGDPSDVDALISDEEANYIVLGDINTFSNAGTPTDIEWTSVTNPTFPALPDDYGIDQEGCWFTHGFNEVAPDQLASVHWERNFTMPISMADYLITSASLTATINGTVDVNIECPGDSVEYSATYDYARFYVLISDLEKNVEYEVAYYQTTNLVVKDQ